MRQRRAARLDLRAALVILALLFVGCTGGPTTPPETVELRMLALDGRWPYDAARGVGLLAEAAAPAPVGALVLGEAMGARAVGDFAGLDADAARALGTALPARGEAHVSRAFALRDGAAEGATLALRSHAWPAPYVATYFEMERTPDCARRPDVKLCFLPRERENETRLRLRVDEGAREGGLLPDLVELGPAGRPAWWNGTFEGPNGESLPFMAHAPIDGPLVPGDIAEPMAAGDWTITFTLWAGGKLAPSGAAGIVRVREPGYLWFDDRLQQIADPQAQARAILANATLTRADIRVARILDTLPLGADVLLSIDDARELAGTPRVTALLANLTPTHERAIDAARGPDGLTLAMRPRALPRAAAPATDGSALVLAAPHDINIAALPPIEGLGAPSLSLATRPPIGEAVFAGGNDIGERLLLLAPAEGPAPWELPAGGRWTRVEDALENLSRSRTLGLASPEIESAAIATIRVDIGEGNTTRSAVIIGGVAGGPSRAFWTSAALASGVGQPVAPRLIVPFAPGSDPAQREESGRRALEAWGPFGVALDR